jgi:putative addiction module component (TIGR02574 family)
MVRNELIQEILQLDSADREFIRDLVSASLTDDLPPQLSPDDQAEMLRRIEQYDKDPSKFESWEQVKERLAQQRANGSK